VHLPSKRPDAARRYSIPRRRRDAEYHPKGFRHQPRAALGLDQVDERKLSDGERFSILQAGFNDFCGMRIVLQGIVPA
jgi:hypothetical protein